MKTKQEKIEEMAQDICGSKDSDICQNGCCNACGDWEYAERAYFAGYRKASEVIDEFFDEIMKKVDSYRKSELFDAFSIRLIMNEARVNIKTKICLENAEMRQEVK